MNENRVIKTVLVSNSGTLGAEMAALIIANALSVSPSLKGRITMRDKQGIDVEISEEALDKYFTSVYNEHEAGIDCINKATYEFNIGYNDLLLEIQNTIQNEPIDPELEKMYLSGNKMGALRLRHEKNLKKALDPKT